MAAQPGRRLGRLGRVFRDSLGDRSDAGGLARNEQDEVRMIGGVRLEANSMHKDRGDHGRSNKFFAHTDFDDDWVDPGSKRDRSRTRRVRHRPHDKYLRGKRIDWLEEFDDDQY